eukprot:CAMPEP_0177644768 /NCGR_PEP_ID=MMETSP0447-20121125/8871_1 /TAXON_ID=0 /ORGANISM="Stygamoeba regulata, Strain BSH-02190019" /LENGTH=36 /DNA_ID= /DNA_START= /DNA_END= /DNA_ORIENTATION=
MNSSAINMIAYPWHRLLAPTRIKRYGPSGWLSSMGS